MSTLWSAYCIDESEIKMVWSDAVPTECPNDPEHSINDDSVSIITKEQYEMSITPFITHIKNVNSTDYIKIASFVYDGNSREKIRRIKFTSYVTNSASYMVELFDVTNAQVIKESTFNNMEEELNDLGEITGTNSGEILYNINAKLTNANPLRKVFFNDINIYSGPELT
jgi:hypothetical protein